jgi:hypothetical protein
MSRYLIISVIVGALIFFNDVSASVDNEKEMVHIQKAYCDGGRQVRWRLKEASKELTYQIYNDADKPEQIVTAIRNGIRRWETVQDVYILKEVNGTDEDVPHISIIIGKLYFLFEWGTKFVCDSDGSGVVGGAYISIDIQNDTGFTKTAISNLSSHEFGHALGLGHIIKPFPEDVIDLMDANIFEKNQDRVMCPSTLAVRALANTSDLIFSIPKQEWKELDCKK